MKAIVKKDTYVLVPNKEHENFTASGEIIEEGTIVNGEEKNINGKRRGEPFTYRLFITDKKQIIYLKSIEPMETTEVTLGADSQVSPTTVNFKPAETFNKVKIVSMVIGAAAGFAFAKYKKKDMKKVAMYIAGGAAAGYGIGYLIDRNRSVTIKESK